MARPVEELFEQAVVERDEARRDAARWRRKYRELKEQLERHQRDDLELHRAQSQRALSAKAFLAVAHREHAALCGELEALDDDLVAVVRTLAASLSAVIDRALESPFEHAAPLHLTDAAEPPTELEQRAGGTIAPRRGLGRLSSSPSPVKLADAVPLHTRVLHSTTPPSPLTPNPAPSSVGSSSSEEEEPSLEGAADQLYAAEGSDAARAHVAGVHARVRAQSPSESVAKRSPPPAPPDRAASPPAAASERRGRSLAVARDAPSPSEPSALPPPPLDPSRELSISVSSVFLSSGAVPPALHHLLLSLDLLGIEGVTCELRPTADAGVHACALHKRIALQPGSRARAKLVYALADDDQHASDVTLVLLASDDDAEAVVLGSALLNLEGVLERGRDSDAEAVTLYAPGGEALGQLTLTLVALRALRAIDRALGEYGSPDELLAAERVALDGRPERADSGAAHRAPLARVREDECEGKAVEAGGAHAPPTEPSAARSSAELPTGADGGRIARAAEPARAAETARAGASATAAAGTRGNAEACAADPQALLSPELQRLRARFHSAEQHDEWATVALAGKAAREGTTRVEATASPTEGFNSPRAETGSNGMVRRRSRMSEGLNLLLSAFGAASPDRRRSSGGGGSRASSVAASSPASPNHVSRSNSNRSASILRKPSFARSPASLTPPQRQLPVSARREATNWT